ncbi:MAG: hypothetical protein ACR2KD_02705 [Thermoleophilaceae bacterium]
MSAAFLERATQGRHETLSAGTTPLERVHPEVVEAMREVGVEPSNRTPQRLTRELATELDASPVRS